MAEYAMIGMFGNCESSSARRIAATCPSIIADGATMSAPALAWQTAIWPSSSRVASLSTCWPSSTPQWPWVVNSQRQTSVMTVMSGTVCLMTPTASWMMPPGS